MKTNMDGLEIPECWTDRAWLAVDSWSAERISGWDKQAETRWGRILDYLDYRERRKLGQGPSMDDGGRAYQAGLAYACGYHD